MFEFDKTDMEIAIGNLYAQLHRLRKDGQYQEEYDTINALMNMLARDRQALREKYNVS